jgi:hypothetical protein
MGTSRHITESQLEQAKTALAVRVKALQEKGVDVKAFKTDPHWRRLDARLRQINMRLRRIAEVETNNAEVEKHKTERLARIAAEKAELKAGTAGKKVKPEKAEPKAGKKEKAPKDKAPKEKKEKVKEKAE